MAKVYHGSKSVIVFDPERRHVYKYFVISQNLDLAREKLPDLQHKYSIDDPNVIKSVCTSRIVENFIGESAALLNRLPMQDLFSLRELYQSCSVVIPEAVLQYIARECLLGLYSLQKREHLLHSCVMPSSILLGRDGSVKLTDMELSSMLIATFDETEHQDDGLSYLSPERIIGATFDSKSDVWGLGVSLVEAALRFYPFLEDQHNNSDLDLCDRILEQPLVGVQRLRQGPNVLSGHFYDFVTRCLARDKAHRPLSVELLGKLGEHITGENTNQAPHPFLALNSNDEQLVKDWFRQQTSCFPAGSSDLTHEQLQYLRAAFD
jgi:serine/threonine protein kinase